MEVFYITKQSKQMMLPYLFLPPALNVRARHSGATQQSHVDGTTASRPTHYVSFVGTEPAGAPVWRIKGV